jgi:uncharacterized protein
VSKSNRLIYEKSPYLLQHAHNPVDWYPWGKEAFQAAKNLDRPIFLSIGYATCHWCHVMEKESFCDPAIAEVLNETFVCIKVDREERPEIDGLYMEFAQVLMSTGGGWPLNVILTPDLKPFYAMTYLPPINSQGMMGLTETSCYINKLWNSQARSNVLARADEVVDLFTQATLIARQENLPSMQVVVLAVEAILDVADTAYGGRKGFPKFPLSYQLEFLMHYAHMQRDSRPLLYVELTLEMMQRGGIYDHLGGGFSRYSVDDKWLIPHFEKMLCDNAILAKSYLEGFKITRVPKFKSVACEILDYLIKEMRDPQGGFYSAQDADSEGEEGFFYTWTFFEIRSLLDTKEQTVFAEFFNLTEDGNFEGRNVLYHNLSLEEYAEERHMSCKEVQEILTSARAKLLQARNKKEKPFKDDKILVGWNALAIESFIQAGSAFMNTLYVDVAIQGVLFIKQKLYVNQQLLRRYREGDARFDATLDDYSYLIRALLSLFEYGAGVEYLQWAIELTTTLEKEFKGKDSAFYFSKENKEDLLIRKYEFSDGLEPAGNSVHADNLMRLARITREGCYKRQAEEIFKAAFEHTAQYPEDSTAQLDALLHYLNIKAPTLIIALDETASLEKELRMFFAENYLPHLVTLWKPYQQGALVQTLAYLKDYTPVDGQTALYLCTQQRCLPPILTISDFKDTISRL